MGFQTVWLAIVSLTQLAYSLDLNGPNPPQTGGRHHLKDVEIDVLPWFVTTLVDPANFEPTNNTNMARLNSSATWISSIFGSDSYLRNFANATFQNWLQGVAAQMHLSPKPAYMCQQYPDYFSTVNFALDPVKPVNLTCWTTAPASDKRSACADGGNAWFRTSDGCYIPDYIITTRVRVPEKYPIVVTKNGKKVKKKFAELTDLLAWCPQPRHQVAAFKEQYNDGTYCYDCASLDCRPSMLSQNNGSVELDCFTYGDNVRGDSLWWRWKSGECYLPNQVFDPFSFYGNGHECLLPKETPRRN